MDRRFGEVWKEMDSRRRAGEPLPDVLRRAPTRDLIAALAAAGERDPVAANALATELLNRQARAPFLGAFLVCVGVVAATFVVDTVLTGDPLLVLAESSLRGYVMAALTSVLGLLSLLLYVSWRGRIRWPAALLHSARLRRGRGGRDPF